MPATCPKCGRNSTVGHFEHPGCPGASAGLAGQAGTPVYVWEVPVELTPDGIPQTKPCPGCNSGSFAPLYLKCNVCKNQWNPSRD